MDAWGPLIDVVVLLLGALILGAIMERLKQSAVVGYMLAGVLLGPYVNLVGLFETGGGSEGAAAQESDLVNQIAQFGVVLLMFTIGLEFSVSKLRTLGLGTLLAGGLQIGATIALVTVAGVALGLGGATAFALGAALALSSTGVVVPVLQRRGDLDSPFGRFCLGILLVQDAAVVPLVLIVSALATGGGAMDVLKGTGVSFGIVGLFVAACWAFAKYVMPALVRFAAPARNREMPILFAFVAAMGSAAAANQVGLSAALGAFIAAIFLGESLIATQLRADMGPFRSVFVTLFFASIGMLLDPAWALAHAPLVAATTAAVLVGKPIVVALVGLVMKLQPRNAVAAGSCMCQIGVFSFVLADVARGGAQGGEGALFNENLFNLVVAVTILCLFATPYGVASARPLGRVFERTLRKLGLSKRAEAPGVQDTPDQTGHVIVVGLGPAGKAVVDAVKHQGGDVVLADLNPRSVLEARALGEKAFVGDASNAEVLKLLGIHTASAIVITLPDHRLTTAVIVEARSMNPAITVVARSRYARYTGLLRAAGAHAVIDEEHEVGRRLGKQVTAVALPELSDRSDETKIDKLDQAYEDMSVTLTAAPEDDPRR
ncbi:MAG: cation:proton antiporter [Planctomycetota bacterium]